MTVESEVSQSAAPEIIQKGFHSFGKPRLGFAETEAQLLPISIRGVHPHGKVNTEDAPYRIDVNVSRFIELLQTEFGFPGNIIEMIEIHIIGEGKKMDEYTKKEREELFPYGSPIKNYFQKKFLREHDLWAITNPLEDRVLLIIYGNLVWRILNGDRKRMAEYLKRKTSQDAASPDRIRALDQETREVKVTEKRVRSLIRSPSRLDKLVTAIAKRDLRESIVHESSHIDDDVNKNPNSFWNEEWKGRLLYVLARFFPPIDDFLEAKAEKKERELGKKHQYFDLITFKINETQNTESVSIEPPKAA